MKVSALLKIQAGGTSMEMIEQFSAYLEQEEKSQLTIEKYIRDVRRFFAWLGQEELSKKATLLYKEELIKSYAVVSVNSFLSSINSFLKFIGRSDCCVKTIKQQRQTFLTADKELSKQEYSRLLNAAGKNSRLCLLMQTICATGIRVSEHRFITVEAARQGYAEVRLKGKHRLVLIPAKLCKMLLKFAKQRKIRQGSIFITASGKPLNRCNIWAEMKKALPYREGKQREGISAQSAAFVCPDLLRHGKGHRPAGGHPGPFQHQYNPHLYHGERQCSSSADREIAAAGMYYIILIM